MNAHLPLKTTFGAEIIRSQPVKSIIPVGTWWKIEHYRKGQLIDHWEQKNVNTTQGLNHMLDVTFHGTTAIGTWYMGLFEDDYTPLVSNTYAAPGFTESTAYTEATRPAFVEAAASSKVTSNNASKAAFTMNATKTIYGAFLCGGGTDGSTKGNTDGGGTLFASSKFSSAKSVVNTDILLVSCTITLADA